jgi:hypothetical protein
MYVPTAIRKSLRLGTCCCFSDAWRGSISALVCSHQSRLRGCRISKHKPAWDLSSIHGFFRRRTSAARGGCFFRMGWARLRKLLKNASTPRSNPPLGPDGPNAPECSRVAYPCRKAQVATAAAVSSGCPETPLAASSKSFQTAFPAPDPYLSGWRVLHDERVERKSFTRKAQIGIRHSSKPCGRISGCGRSPELAQHDGQYFLGDRYFQRFLVRKVAI